MHPRRAVSRVGTVRAAASAQKTVGMTSTFIR